MIKVLDHAARAVARLVTQFKGKTRLENLVALLFGARAQEIENAAWDVLTLTGVSTAFGAQLDGIGKILDLPRDGRDDATYKLWLQAKLKLDTASGTAPEILAIFGLLVGSRTLWLVPQSPAAFVLRVLGEASADYAQLGAVLQSAKAAGVRAILEFLNDTPALTFGVDDAGAGLDDATISLGNAIEY